MNRKPNKWKVALQCENGDISERIFEAHYDRDWDGVQHVVARGAAVMAWYEAGKNLGFTATGVVAV